MAYCEVLVRHWVWSHRYVFVSVFDVVIRLPVDSYIHQTIFGFIFMESSLNHLLGVVVVWCGVVCE